MFKLIKNAKLWHIAVSFAAVALLVFGSGLNGAFQNDDIYQIVNNEPVHSLTNLPYYFQSSTFFNGEKLTGVYYRPLMTTTFAFVYSIFGANPFFYHLLQLIIHTSSAFLIFLIFNKLIGRTAGIFAGLIFLVHPINSQVVYSIPTMQDALFFLFGSLAFWNLLANKKSRSMAITALLLFLALLSKESGVLFVFACFIYLFLFERVKVLTFIKYMAMPMVVYVFLRFNAVGFGSAVHAAPINELDFWQRMMTTPSVLLFYISKFFLPLQLSLGYYWTETSFDVRDVLIPLLVDVAVVGGFIYFGLRAKKYLSDKMFRLYVFFGLWSAAGLGLYLQILPGLDFTACETWMYFSMPALLGMIYIAFLSLKIKSKKLLLGLAIVILVVVVALGVRSHARGYDYVSQYKLAQRDLEVSPDNHAALNNISQELLHQGKHIDALEYATKSVSIYPIVSNHINVGVANQYLGNYQDSLDAYQQALKYGNMAIIYQNMALVHFVYSDTKTTKDFFKQAIIEYPHDFRILLYYSIFEKMTGNDENAVMLLADAMQYGNVPYVVYDGIVNDKPFSIPVLDKTISIN